MISADAIQSQIVNFIVSTYRMKYTKSDLQEQKRKRFAPGEDRTHDLQIAQHILDYETDALPTALPRPLGFRRLKMNFFPT